MGEQDPDEGRRTRHEIIREQHAEGSNIGARHTQRIRAEHVVESKVRAREHVIILGEVIQNNRGRFRTCCLPSESSGQGPDHRLLVCHRS